MKGACGRGKMRRGFGGGDLKDKDHFKA